jgi:hypothetical protein
MEDKKSIVLKCIAEAIAGLEPHVASLGPYGTHLQIENLRADVRAAVARDDLLDDPEVAFALSIFENKVSTITKLMTVQMEAAAAYSVILREQLNRSADQRFRAYVQLSNFSEKLVVMGASFLGAAITLLGLLSAKLQGNVHLRGIRSFEAVIFLLVASIGIAVWTQLRANWSANANLMATAEVHDNQLSYERNMAFNRSTALRSNDQTKPSNDEIPKMKSTKWDNGLVLRLQATSVALIVLSMLLFVIFVVDNLPALFQSAPPSTSLTHPITQPPSPASPQTPKTAPRLPAHAALHSPATPSTSPSTPISPQTASASSH